MKKLFSLLLVMLMCPPMIGAAWGSEEVEQLEETSDDAFAEPEITEKALYNKTEDALIEEDLDEFLDGTLVDPTLDGESYSGICGSDLTWSLTNDGVLTISGTGEMDNHYSYEDYPWYDKNNHIEEVFEEGNNFIKEVIVEDGVKSVGNWAFGKCTALISVTFPDSLTSIGNCAFYGCRNLDSISCGDSNDSFNSIDIGIRNEMLLIAYYGSITGICEDGLSWKIDRNGLLTISGTGEMMDYNWWFGAPWSDESYSDAVKEVIIAPGITRIGDSAFLNCISIESITIPDSVTSIGNYVFRECSGLLSVSIGSGMTNIAAEAFRDCPSLISIIVSEQNPTYTSVDGVLFTKDIKELVAYPDGKQGAYNIPDGVQRIGDRAFYTCEGLTDLTIPNSVMILGIEPFVHCINLKTVYIGSGLTGIFGFNYGAVLLGLPSPFMGCTSLTSINVSEENSTFTAVDGALFTKDMKTMISYPVGKEESTYIIPYGVSNTLSSVFYFSKLVSVTIPDSLTSLESSLFMYSTNLAAVTIPKSVTAIGFNTFDHCLSLTDVYYGGTEEEWNLIWIDEENLGNKTLTDSTIHYNTMGSGVFFDVNEDGENNPADAARILRDSTTCAVNTGDVSSDGKVNNYDAVLILQYSVGIIT